jgi:hypothetical protein
MKTLFFLAFAVGALVGSVRAQTAVQTIELPSLDRSQIAFRLETEPSVVLGPERVPSFVNRQNNVMRFGDGRIAFSTPWGISSLQVADPQGRVIRIGDFSISRQLEQVCRTGDDRLLVLHSRTQFTIFNSAGAPESSGTRPGAVTFLCPADQPRVWVRVTVQSASPGPPTEQPHDRSVTARRGKAALRLIDLGADSRVVADLGEFDAADYYPVGPIPRTQGRDRPPFYAWWPRPFTRSFSAAVDRGRIHTGDGTTWEVRTWDSSGRLVRILRVALPPEPVTQELRSAFVDEYFAGNSADYRERTTGHARFRDLSIYPANLPAFSDLRVDPGGRLWVKRYPKPLEKTQEWWVFTADAQYLGRVDMPAAFIVDDIGDDYVAGSYLRRKAAQPESDAIMDTSEYDVRVYRLRR